MTQIRIINVSQVHIPCEYVEYRVSYSMTVLDKRANAQE